MYLNPWVYWALTISTWTMIAFSVYKNGRTWHAMRRTDRIYAETMSMFTDVMREVVNAPMVVHDQDRVTVEMNGALYGRIAAMSMTDDMINKLKP